MTRYKLSAPAILVFFALISPIGATETPWDELASGLDVARFEDEGLTVLRIDPGRWETVALAVSDVGGSPRSARQWGQDHALMAVINAGMYAKDHLTHTGYFHIGDHLNNGIWNQKDYKQAACFGPRQPGLPLFALHDLDAVPESTFTAHYDVVVQNLRLIKHAGDNRWSPGTRRWSEACLGEDSQGRMLWIHCRKPRTMHDLNEVLLDLPIDLVAAQHLEGGVQAQLWVDPDLAELDLGGWPVPNVLGIRPR